MRSLHLQWKFKLWAGKFALGVHAKYCFWKQKVCCHPPVIFFKWTFLPIIWISTWKDRIQAIFLNLFYFTSIYFRSCFLVWCQKDGGEPEATQFNFGCHVKAMYEPKCLAHCIMCEQNSGVSSWLQLLTLKYVRMENQWQRIFFSSKN